MDIPVIGASIIFSFLFIISFIDLNFEDSCSEKIFEEEIQENKEKEDSKVTGLEDSNVKNISKDSDEKSDKFIIIENYYS